VVPTKGPLANVGHEDGSKSNSKVEVISSSNGNGPEGKFAKPHPNSSPNSGPTRNASQLGTSSKKPEIGFANAC